MIIALVQWGNREDGFTYEVICPFCAKTVNVFEDKDDAGEPLTEEQVNTVCKKEMSIHIPFCSFAGQRLMVEITREPLHTDDKVPPRIM